MYKHRIEVEEKQTANLTSLESRYGVQVIIGTAPVHLAENPEETVKKPILVENMEDAKTKLGYSDDWDKYTLCQSMYAAYQMFGRIPVVFINVLDPKKHTTENEEKEYAVSSHQVVLQESAVLKSSVVVKKGEEALVPDKDYILSYQDESLVVTLLSSGAGFEETVLKISSKSLAPEKVTESEVIGAYDASTGAESGMELIRQVYPLYGFAPALLLAPGWSQEPAVGVALQGKCTEINGVFRCECVLDLDTETVKKYTDCKKEKDENGYTGNHAIVCWPMLNAAGRKIFYSAVYGAAASYYTIENDDVPYLYPSNILLGVSGAVLADGTEITLDSTQAQSLNGDGIVTAINQQGWKIWGNNMACYPENQDPKDRWIGCRRMFSFVANYFIQTYHSKLDSAMNRVAIDDIVNSFNIWGNSLKARGMCAGIRVEYLEKDNPEKELLQGHVKFRLYIAPYTPMEYILATEEFDLTTLRSAITGTGGTEE